MKMSKLSNQTNSQDPQAVNSRVFVGNLNTFQCSKTDVERMFQKYGRLAGISMHKGYAFVQFTNPFDARNACLGEDGRTVLSQILDVNMVAEPKPHQTGRKRQNLSKTGNDWDYYYDSYYASTLFTPTPPRPLKRQRLMSNQNRSSPIPNKILTTNAIAPQPPQQQQQQQQQLQQQQQQQIPNNHQPQQNGNNGGIQLNNGIVLEHQQPQQQIYQLNGTLGSTMNCSASNGSTSSLSSQSSTASIQIQSSTSPNPSQQQNNNGHHLLGPFKVYSNPDTLICGNCRECFTELSELLDHKKSYCKLRFICKCQTTTTSMIASTPTTQEFNSNNINNNDNLQNSPKLLCVVCKEPFKNPWDLMVHAQAAHMINIYELGDTHNNNNNDTNNNNNNNNDNSNDNDDNNNTDKKEMVHVTNGLNGMAELKDDNSSIHGSPYKDDTSNVHSSNENLYEDQLSSSSPILSNDEHMKQNGHDSEDDGVCETKSSCIMRTLSIETIPTSANVVVNPLSIVTNSIGITLANGAMVSQ